MPRGASPAAAPSPGSTARRPRFAARERRSSPTRMAGLVARHACRCPDPSRSAGDSTRAGRRTARCSGFRCRAQDCRESCWDSRVRHPVPDSVPRSVASRWPSVTCQLRSRGRSAGSLPLRQERSRVRPSPCRRASRASPCSRSRDRLRTSRAPRDRAVRVVSCRPGPSGRARSSCPSTRRADA